MEIKKVKLGFTLIELIMVIVILGILAAVALPKFFNLSTQADQAAEEGVVGGVRAGIQTAMASDSVNHAWPTALDTASNADCTTANPCFDGVLSQGGVTQSWTKISATVYEGPTTTQYTYCATTGEFE